MCQILHIKKNNSIETHKEAIQTDEYFCMEHIHWALGSQQCQLCVWKKELNSSSQYLELSRIQIRK